jgi:hypothetical protein
MKLHLLVGIPPTYFLRMGGKPPLNSISIMFITDGILPAPPQDAPCGQADKGSSPALWISTIEQLFSSIHALYLTLSRLAETCILRWSGYII